MRREKSKKMQKQFKVNDFVFVLPSRGKTPGIARVTEITPHGEAKIVYDNGLECFRKRKQFLIDRANKVGKK